MKSDNNRFHPPRYLRHPMLQTVLNSSSLRTLGGNAMVKAQEEVILPLSGGVRLQGYLSRHGDGSARGLVILMHGWEGSARSAYILHTGRYLYGQGFDVFRLNFRDHGETHHLNEGFFMGTLLDEVHEAAARVAERAKAPVFLAGFSMGANFTLRLASLCTEKPIPALKRAVAVNPPLDPMESTRRIDGMGLIKAYFIKKWKRSLKCKQELFPGKYKLDDILRMDTCLEMTETLIRRYSDYPNAAAYFRGYAVTGDTVKRITLPVTVITSEDDPVVPAEDFSLFLSHSQTELLMQSYGGHCGYIESLALSSWYEPKMAEIFSRP